MRIKKARRELAKDFIFILVGVLIAVTLSRLGVIDDFIKLIGNEISASFMAGIFFTSVFTIAPAAIALTNIADVPIFTISFWGALGALCGDLILFYFIRDRFAENLISSIKPSVTKNVLNSFHLGFMKWLSPLLGAIIIASPLPDELGLTLLGISKTKISVLIPISFVMNFIGIFGLIYLVRIV
jgi:membrane protein DedA with SNARE-associated domain